MNRIGFGAVLAFAGLVPLLGMAQQAPAPATSVGLYRGHLVHYAIVNGRPVFQGDILLDRLGDPADFGKAGVPGMGTYGVFLWPKVGGEAIVPYTVTSGTANLTKAIANFNKTFTGLIKWVPRGSQADYVDFDLDPGNHSGACESYVGRIGGKQEANGSIDCIVSVLMHEMGHAVGLYHEQSRFDRASYVTLDADNIFAGEAANFAIEDINSQDVGLYDYGSLMAYSSFLFSKNGAPVLESIPPGMPLGNETGFSSGDIDTIERLYGAVPSAVTVATNPPGLKVTVDGTLYATPHAFSWTLNSKHTVAAPTAVQTRAGVDYIFGRWNDNGAASHSITVAPGGGTVVAPTGRPAVTVYTANFIELVNAAVSIPTGGGTVTEAPAPKTYAGSSAKFYIARQPITLTAKAGAGNYLFLLGQSVEPFAANPKSLYAAQGTMVAYFVSPPVIYVTTSPPGLQVLVNGGDYAGPIAVQGTSATVSAPAPPVDTASKTVFVKWSDGKAATHTVTTTSGAATTVTATLKEQFAASLAANPSCAGTVTAAPPAAFYNSGTTIAVSAHKASGWMFAGWQGDLTGATTPKNLLVNGEKSVVANFNTAATPLAVTKLTPATVKAGGGAVTVTVTGTGFTAKTVVYVDSFYTPGTETVVNGTTIKVNLSATQVAKAATFDFQAVNSTATCQIFDGLPFFVVN
jgi:hypothetical protein